jgi:LEA14-like dessication related protein
MNAFTLCSNPSNMTSLQKYSAILTSCFFLFITGCQKPLAPEYQGFENLQIGKLTVQESLISTNLKFYNPNTFGLQLKKAEMDIYVNEKLADHYVLDSTINISKLDTFYIPVSLKIDFKNIFNNALQSLLTNEVKIRLAGYAKLKKGAIGFKVPLLYEEKQKLDAFLNQ